MKKIFKTMLVMAAGLSAVSCASWLETSSPSVVDADFVFSDFGTGKDVMLGAYNSYISIVNEGTVINLEVIGSDLERASVGIIANQIGAAQLYGPKGTSYDVPNFDINDKNLAKWGTFYSVISRCNNIISNIKNLPEYEQIISAKEASDWSDLLGQAYAMRATCYYDLARLYGDVIYMTEAELGQDIKTLTGRDEIIEKEIRNLMAIEPLMYRVGENNHLPDQMTRNYVQGLIGRLCFMEAGYATRRTDLGDDFYKDADGNVLTFEIWGTDDERNAAYGRRSDWKDFYAMAVPYLEAAVNEPGGGVSLITVDPRSDKEGRSYGNPFQYYFDQVTKQVMPMESIYEVTMKQEGGGSRIAYNWGRGSNGGSPAYPPKSNAQLCSYPEVFYGFYDPMDMRRDATLSVTGSTGGGAEALYSYSLSNKNTIGIGMNKYDLNRQTTPDTRQLYSGINYVLMRQSDVILMLAEAYAVTGEGDAETELKKVHNRAFPDDIENEKYIELLASCDGDVLEAIYKERGLELLGENSRRWDLIRTGKLPEVAVNYRKTLVDGIADLKSQGYIQYDNGNQYPAYVWTKLVNAREELGYRLTMQTPADLLVEGVDDTSLEYALLVPGWRGQHDDWESVAVANGASATDVIAGDNTNLAIVGLTRYIAPDSPEAQELEADGYVQTNWGVLTYMSEVADTDPVELQMSSAREAQWSSEFMVGYSDADYAAKKAPIYLIPMQATVCATTGLQNGYGFKSK